ncbi:hypothetical protein GCM10023331_16890 [Algivirga pacifica]|uniref:Doubled CXXCH motif domain-containing protein n=2 Tax=Algivirga pacifica TaxID=1162670 RepID=A0ABP9D815_9BACT
MEPQVIQIKEASANVVQNNCQRCHSHQNENVATTGIDLEARNHGEGKMCWDCHREVPHGRVKSQSSTPHARVPLTDSPTPSWLKEVMTKDTHTK